MTVVAQEDHLTAGAWATYGSSDPSPKSKTNMVKPRKRRFHFIESDSDTD